MFSNHWHNGIFETISLAGNRTVNQHTPVGAALCVFEGYNNVLQNFHVEEFAGFGIWYSGGQSNAVNIVNVESEQERSGCMYIVWR